MVQKPQKVISSKGNDLVEYFRDLFRYKDLLLTLSLRDFKVRYSQTFLGFLWVLIQPICTVAVLVFVFEKTLHVDAGVPYPLYAMSGMVLWTYFSYVLSQSGTSIIGSQSMISKVYFPRMIIPISKAFVGLIDFMVSFLILCLLFFVFRHPVSAQVVFAPVFFLLALLASLGAGILFSALTVRYRDFQYVIPFILQFGLYITPIAYPTSFIPDRYKWLYFLNPMVGAIEGLRWSIFGANALDPFCYFSFAISIVLFAIGIVSFAKVESKMADLV